MVDWLKNFFMPIIELTFIGGFAITIIFIVWRAFNKMYSTKWRWFLKYTIFRNKYDPKVVKWILDAIENDMGYYDAKKFLMIKGTQMQTINEVMWIFEKIFKELQGGVKDGQRTTRSDSKIKLTEITGLPTTKTIGKS